jgi:type I restriction-modification system DNA methylase subunit
MVVKNFHKYLINLGFSEKEVSKLSYENIFSYSPSSESPPIKYIHVRNQEDIFNQHLRLWNRNNDNVFIAVDDSKTYIVDCKKKPSAERTAYLQTFDYGVNSIGYEDISIELISKSHIDSSIFYQFIQKNQRKKQEVDKDLLLNLIALRNDLISDNNNKVIHLLILRCLFVKYLEDRGIFETNFLSDILKSNSSEKIINAFSEVCKINGDVFGGNRLFEGEIKVDYLEKLYLFFTTDYQSGQGTLFPYQFNNIPIQLISHVYEAFLNNNIKKGKGVYYTPSFVVDFMLSQSLKKKVEENPYLTILDPAVGSGAFLVESFKVIRDILSKQLKRKLHYNEKKQILEKQLWGIDTDNNALQITAFSLYLALLEDEPSEFIKNEIENSHPILPSMIGTVLVNGNTIVDSIFEENKFDFIVSNPPWGSIPTDEDEGNITEREAIDNKKGVYPEYNSVADYERSQAFLMRIEQWQKEDTVIAMIVKNSIFLNDKAVDFRKEFLEKNQIQTFYELSNYNRILFRKKVIGKIRGKETVEIGASEPCVILIFKPKKNNKDYKINYIAPKLTKFGEHFEVIQYTENESFYIKKSHF